MMNPKAGNSQTEVRQIHLLAADRVYHFASSPKQTASSYLALFTLARLSGAVLFLWHFP